MKKQWADKAFRAAAVEKMKRNWEDPTIRNKRMEGIARKNDLTTLR